MHNNGLTNTISVVLMISLLFVGLFAGFFIHSILESPEQENNEIADWMTKSIILAGSTTVLPIASVAADEFMNTYSGPSITVSAGGSGAGYRHVIDEEIEIGMASRSPSQLEINAMQDTGNPMYLYPIALDAVCVVVNPSVANDSYPLHLTLEVTGKIFSGNYTRWSQLDENLPDQEIQVITRPDGSGTRGTFEEFCLDPWGLTITQNAETHEGNPDVAAAVSNTPYSVGYVGFGFLSEDLYAVPMAKTTADEYFNPTTQTLASFSYPLSRYLYFVTNCRPESGSLVDRFIDFVKSPIGQAIVENQGFISLPEYPAAT